MFPWQHPMGAQLFCFLTESVSRSVCFSDLPAAFTAFARSIANYINSYDSLSLADWEQ